MSSVLAAISAGETVEFARLFDVSEGRSGVVVTFLAMLELLKESLIEAVQARVYGPIHIRARQSPPVEDAAPPAMESEGS
jgi:segregation and condensation protein A